MKTCQAICFLVLLGLAPLGAAIVEEETWYNAEGKVVKTVKRTLTGADARAREASTWEPAWVIRERRRDERAARCRPYRARYWSGGYGCYYAPYVSYYGVTRRSYSGFKGYYNNGRWGVGYRAPGFRFYYRN